VRLVAGDEVSIVELVPAGAQPHGYELTPRQARELLDADLAVVTGGGYQPDVEATAARRDGPTVVALEALAVEGDDPHVWLDPLLMREAVKAVAEALRGIGVHADEADAVEELDGLHARFAAGLEPCRRRELVVSHAAFGYLALRYGLEQVAVEDAGDRAAVERARQAIRAGATPFVETLSPAPALEVLAAEEGVETEVLNPAEGLVPREQAAGATYRSLLLYDLETLVDHLDC